MIVILSLCIAICYIFRTSISTTIIEISKEMSINENIQGYILSAFSFGYVAFMLIGGLLVDRFGTNRILTITMIILSLSTILLGFAHYWICILILRFLIGALEAPAFPACAKFVNKNFGTTERGRATSIFDTGSYVGAAICVPIIVFFISKYSWRESQYFFGILGLVWVFLWFLFTKNKEKISDESQKEKGKTRRRSGRTPRYYHRTFHDGRTAFRYIRDGRIQTPPRRGLPQVQVHPGKSRGRGTPCRCICRKDG